jgi:YidC/Oxa1 family membrane protein insertase
MIQLYNTLAYEPIYNTLIFIYNLIPLKDFGVAIILTTFLVRLVLYPVYQKQISSQKKLQELQPKIKHAQNKHKHDKEEQAKVMMGLYKEHGVNPVSGCLPAVVSLIVLLAIYRSIVNIAHNNFLVTKEHLYAFVADPGQINHMFLGMIDLTTPNILLAVVTAIAQYFQMKSIMGAQPQKPATNKEGEPDFAAIMNKQMVYMLPAITLFVGVTFPAALTLYWLTSTLLMLLQQKMLRKNDVTTVTSS